MRYLKCEECRDMVREDEASDPLRPRCPRHDDSAYERMVAKRQLRKGFVDNRPKYMRGTGKFWR